MTPEEAISVSCEQEKPDPLEVFIQAHTERFARAIRRAYAAGLRGRKNGLEMPAHLLIAEIKGTVAGAFGVSISDLECHRRSVGVARPRQIAMYLCMKLTPHSTPVIGRHFGGRDHTTVIHAVRRIEQLAKSDPDFGERVASLKKQLDSS